MIKTKILKKITNKILQKFNGIKRIKIKYQIELIVHSAISSLIPSLTPATSPNPLSHNLKLMEKILINGLKIQLKLLFQ